MSGELKVLPLFPLHTVLYPGTRLPLRIFEQRYMDMAKDCLKREVGFGICLILHGREAGEPAIPEEVGTLARIVEWDMQQLGVLQVVAQGGQRFKVLDYHAERSGLLRASVKMLPDDPPDTMTAAHEPLLVVLRAIFQEMGEQAPPEPHRFDDAAWVSFRFAELLPFYRDEKQRLLEMGSSTERLAAVKRFLQNKGLLRD